jgi:hypothetical protein
MPYIPSFIKIGSSSQKLLRDSQRAWRQERMLTIRNLKNNIMHRILYPD